MEDYLDGRYLSTEDSKFVHLITSDIDAYLKKCEKFSSNVLLFPPFLNYFRFLIHKTVEKFASLKSFSIGVGDNRRTVVSTADLMLKMEDAQKKRRPDKAIYVAKSRHRSNELCTQSKPAYPQHRRQKENAQMLQEYSNLIVKEEINSLKVKEDICQIVCANNLNGINLQNENSLISVKLKEASNLGDVLLSDEENNRLGDSNDSNKSSEIVNKLYYGESQICKGHHYQTAFIDRIDHTSDHRDKNIDLCLGSHKELDRDLEIGGRLGENINIEEENCSNRTYGQCIRDMPNDKTHALDMRDTDVINLLSTLSDQEKDECSRKDNIRLSANHAFIDEDLLINNNFNALPTTLINSPNVDSKSTTPISNINDNDDSLKIDRLQVFETSLGISNNNNKVELCSNGSDTNTNVVKTSISCESKKLKKKSKSKNLLKHSKNRNKETCVSESIDAISKSTDLSFPIANDSPDKINKENEDKMVESNAESNDSWFEIFNQNGYPLKQQEYQQICEKVGKVTIQNPQFDYLVYTPREIQIDDDEFGHLLEIYDFPVEIKSEDIHSAFTHIPNAEFDIKWVDDTHAILIFSSIISAKAATVGFNNPKMKLRQISWASRNTKLKVKKFSGLLLPHKARPMVVTNVAHNMVANALGIRPTINKEKQDRDKKIIKDARESRKALLKSRQAAWDGFKDE